MPDVDLETLAAGYAHRPTTPAARERARAAWERAGGGIGEWGIDVGGGRGDHAAVWRGLGARAVVVDPAQGMVDRARRHGAAIAGHAERLPLRGGSAALVYFHLSIHHCDWRAALAEAARVLRPGGHVEIWTWILGPGGESYMGSWFPTVVQIDSRRFPDLGEVARALPDVGLALVERGTEIEHVERTAGEWVAAVEHRFVSTLQLVPPAELEAGLAAFRAAHPDPEQEVRYRRFFGFLTAARSLP